MISRNLVRRFTFPAIRNGNGKVFSTSTATATATADESSSVKKETLLQRLMGGTYVRDPTPKQPVSQILSEWTDQGREVRINDLRNSIKQFRKMKRYDHALEISEWAVDTEMPDLSSGDAAIRLDLIYKVRGMEAAERYFESLPEDLKGIYTYGALLNGYVKEKLIDKAEAVMQNMRELGYAKILSYNGMFHLYSQTGKSMKLKALVEEMEAKDIHFDRFSYNILMNAYASASDIVEMETLLRKMEADPHVVLDWAPYSVAAKGYQKAGDFVNAEIMLKKAEGTIKKRLNSPKEHEMACQAFQFLMTQYACMGRKDEVYRLWKSHRAPQKLINKSYTSIISSLLKLDDIDGAVKMLDEWFLKKVSWSFDIRIPNIVIAAYCKKGQMQKAESLVSLIVERGGDPNGSTWSSMASGYCNSNQMEEAVKMMKKTISQKPRWRPDFPVLVSCLNYLREKGKVDEAEEIIGLVDESGGRFRDRISRYIRKGDLPEPDKMKQESEAVEDDTIDASELEFETSS